MLRIYPVVLEVLKQLQPVVRRIELKDRDLGRQLRRCSSSIALNVAEGMYSRGRNRNARYHSALVSARETLACLEVAAVCGYADADVAFMGAAQAHHRHVGQAGSWRLAAKENAEVDAPGGLSRDEHSGQGEVALAG